MVGRSGNGGQRYGNKLDVFVLGPLLEDGLTHRLLAPSLSARTHEHARKTPGRCSYVDSNRAVRLKFESTRFLLEGKQLSSIERMLLLGHEPVS